MNGISKKSYTPAEIGNALFACGMVRQALHIALTAKIEELYEDCVWCLIETGRIRGTNDTSVSSAVLKQARLAPTAEQMKEAIEEAHRAWVAEQWKEIADAEFTRQHEDFVSTLPWE